MAAADWRTDQLIASIRRRCNAPSSTEGWADSDFLLMATDEMRDSIVPMLRRLSEEFLVVAEDSNIVSGTSEYALPSWATGEALRDVQVLDGGEYNSLRRIEPHQASNIPAGAVSAYYLRDDKVTLAPSPTAAVTSGLRLKCLMRPGKLVALSRGYSCGAPSGADLSLTALDGSASAQSFFGASATVDVIKSNPGFRVLVKAAAVTVSSGTMTFASASVISSVSSGDVVCVTDESVVPQIPAELHPLLQQATACAYLRASGGPGLGEAEAKRQSMEAEAAKLFSPRTENQPRYMANPHGAGWGARRYWGR